MFSLGMVSTNLFMHVYVGDTEFKLPKAGNKWEGIFSYEWVRFARRADKDVALQYHYR